jgi:hypothetical protein
MRVGEHPKISSNSGKVIGSGVGDFGEKYAFDSRGRVLYSSTGPAQHIVYPLFEEFVQYVLEVTERF